MRDFQLAQLAGGYVKKGTREPIEFEFRAIHLVTDRESGAREEEIRDEIEQYMKEKGVSFE